MFETLHITNDNTLEENKMLDDKEIDQMKQAKIQQILQEIDERKNIYIKQLANEEQSNNNQVDKNKDASAQGRFTIQHHPSQDLESPIHGYKTNYVSNFCKNLEKVNSAEPDYEFITEDNDRETIGDDIDRIEDMKTGLVSKRLAKLEPYSRTNNLHSQNYEPVKISQTSKPNSSKSSTISKYAEFGAKKIQESLSAVNEIDTVRSNLRKVKNISENNQNSYCEKEIIKTMPISNDLSTNLEANVELINTNDKEPPTKYAFGSVSHRIAAFEDQSKPRQLSELIDTNWNGALQFDDNRDLDAATFRLPNNRSEYKSFFLHFGVPRPFYKSFAFV